MILITTAYTILRLEKLVNAKEKRKKKKKILDRKKKKSYKL